MRTRPAPIATRMPQRSARARLLASVLLVWLLAIAISACGGSSSGPSGAYTTTISFAERLGGLASGTWTVTFGKGGSYTITKGGPELSLATGRGSFYRGTTFVINPVSAGACGPGPGTGTYRLKLSGNTLRFVRLQDPCKTRSAILAHTFTKVH